MFGIYEYNIQLKREPFARYHNLVPPTSFAQNLQTVDRRVAYVPTSTLLNQARGVLYTYLPHTVPNYQIPPQQSQNIMSNGIHEQIWVAVNTGQWR